MCSRPASPSDWPQGELRAPVVVPGAPHDLEQSSRQRTVISYSPHRGGEGWHASVGLTAGEPTVPRKAVGWTP